MHVYVNNESILSVNKKTCCVFAKGLVGFSNSSNTTMSYNARLLAPWAPAFVEFDTVDEYCDWMNKISDELLAASTADWINLWMNTAKSFDILWLDDESRPCLPEKAEIQLMRN
jgi:hypothetical protein